MKIIELLSSSVCIIFIGNLLQKKRNRQKKKKFQKSFYFLKKFLKFILYAKNK